MAAPKKPRSVGQKSDKEWRDAIRLAVNEVRKDPENGKKTKALRLLARKTVTMALDGDMIAMKEIGDRLDGRPAQSVDTNLTGDLVVNVVRFSD